MSHGFSRRAFRPVTHFIQFIFIEREVIQSYYFRSVEIESVLGFRSLLTVTSENVVSIYGNLRKLYLYFICYVPGPTRGGKHQMLPSERLNDYESF